MAISYKTKTNKSMPLVLAAVIIIVQVMPVYACGPFFPFGVYAYLTHPVVPLKKFAAGELGILHPGMAMSYLSVAYRYLTSNPLSPSQQLAAQNLWHKRLAYCFEYGKDEVNLWLAIRNTVPGVKKLESYDIRMYGFRPYFDCTYAPYSYDALVTAATTLKARIKTYGIASQQVKTWVNNQDLVFASAFTPIEKLALPKPPAEPTDKLCLADYKYQLAATYLYADNTLAARNLFSKIATDRQSPWQNLAKYLVVRCVFDEFVLKENTAKNPPPDKAINPDELKSSEQYAESCFHKALTDPDLLPYKKYIQGYIDYLNFRLHPLEYYRSLVSMVLNKNDENFEHHLDDYTLILDSFQDNKDLALVECSKDDITDWVLSYQSETERNLSEPFKKHIFDRWQTTKSIPWLIAALTICKPNDPQSKELIAAAQAVSDKSPGYLSIQYYCITLQKDLHEQKAAQKLDALLSENLEKVPPSAHNMLLALREQFSNSLNEYINYGLKRPVAITCYSDPLVLPDAYDQIEKSTQFRYAGPATFDTKLSEALNKHLPFSGWYKLSQNKTLPRVLHNEIIAATWMRAVLLDRNDIAKELTPYLQTAYPKIKSLLAAYLKAENPAERNFAACYVILRAPGLSPYIRGDVGRFEKDITTRSEYGDNFWTPIDPNEKPPGEDTFIQTVDDLAIWPVHINRFLSGTQKKEAAAETQRMLTTVSPARFAYEKTIAWLKVNPSDPRIPEALYVITKMPRWGSEIPDASKYSKLAFKLLHSRFVGNRWTNRALYYY